MIIIMSVITLMSCLRNFVDLFIYLFVFKMFCLASNQSKSHVNILIDSFRRSMLRQRRLEFVRTLPSIVAYICFFQIVIEVTSSETSIDIDDVSFSKESCSEIPWAPYQGMYQSN